MPTKLNFLLRAYRQSIPSVPRPAFVLTTDNWDDYGHKVQFHLSYVDAEGSTTRLGPVKILQKTNVDGQPIDVAKTTKLPEAFSGLSEEFVSLGQEEDYYKNLHALFGSKTSDILDSLRDIAWRPTFAADFEPSTAFRNAMMRENGAHRARRFGASWAAGEPVNENLAFTYLGTIEGADAAIEAAFAFNSGDPVPVALSESLAVML